MARCNCSGGAGTGCTCAFQAGDNVTISGTGSGVDPYVISSTTSVEEIREAFSAGDGVEYDPDTGVIGAALSVDAGNQVVFSPDGGLYVPPPGSGASGGALGMVVYNTAGSSEFIKGDYPTARWIRVRVTGGGGGGAGATSAASQIRAGGGGAGGNYAESWLETSALPASVPITVGAGGGGGPAGNGAGSSGGTTQFGSLVTAFGGGGAPVPGASGANGVSDGGAPQGLGNGQLQSLGERGGRAVWVSSTIGTAGNGGSAGGGYGAGGRGGFISGAANGGGGSSGGAGGGGGMSAGTAPTAGGSGGTGFVLVELFT